MTRFLLPLIFLLIIPAFAFGQFSPSEHAKQNAKNQNAAKEAKSASAARRNAQRRSAQYNKYFRLNREMREQSDGFFGSFRTWKSGIYSTTGYLAEVKSGKVTIIVRDEIQSVRLSKLSEEDQKHVKLFMDWKREPKKDRLKWIEGYRAEQLAQRRAVVDAQRDRANAIQAQNQKRQQEHDELMKRAQELRQKQMDSHFEKLQTAYRNVVINETTEATITAFTGITPNISNRRKTISGETWQAVWIASNSQGKKLALIVELRNGIAATAILEEVK